MFDLGSLAGDLGVLGDRSVATSINNLGQIIGTSNYLMAHKRTFLRGNNRAVAWIDMVIKEVNCDLEPESSVIALSINNNGFATYNDTKSNNFAIDLLSNTKTKIWDNGWFTNRVVEINDNNDMFVFHIHDYIRDNQRKKISDHAFIKTGSESNIEDIGFYTNVYFANSFENPQQWKPRSFRGAYDYNNRRWIVGVAENIFGERHGVLLIPNEE
jgi:hypothetical protein